MIIYFAFIIPIFTILVLILFFRRHITWWEYLLNFGVPTLLIFICKFFSTVSMTNDIEILNNYVTNAEYIEKWDEWIEETCYQTCYDRCTDDSGSTYDCNPHDCHPYDCSYCETHEPSWTLFTSDGKSISINSIQFEQFSKMWNNRKFIDMNRDFYHIDGNKYTTVTDTNLNHVVPTTTSHTYENKVQCSRSVFNYQKVDSADIKDFGLYDYPKVDLFSYNPILGWNDYNASYRLQRWNARIGAFKQVHMMILIFKDKPVQSALLQEAYWKGGNKNEFILCIGVKNNKIDWAKVISWTEVDELKIGVEKTVSNMNLNMIEIIDYIAKEVRSKFVRKKFKDFSYLNVEPTQTAIYITFILVFLFSIGIAIFVIKNEI